MSFDRSPDDGQAAEAAWPSAIRLDRGAGMLELDWDGRSAALSQRVLRRSCRCSECESRRRRLDDVLPVAADVMLEKAEPVGIAGLQLFFSDGHSRGIYPWAYLRQIAFGPAVEELGEALTKGWRDE